MEAAERPLNDPVHGNDSRDQLKMGIERQNHSADSFGAFCDQRIDNRYNNSLPIKLPQQFFRRLPEPVVGRNVKHFRPNLMNQLPGGWLSYPATDLAPNRAASG